MKAFVWCSVLFEDPRTSKSVDKNAEFLKKAEEILKGTFRFAGKAWELEMVSYHWELDRTDEFKKLVEEYKDILRAVEYEIYYLREPDEEFIWEK